MTCSPGNPTFRLLDAYVGWDEAAAQQLAGLEDPAGIRLVSVARSVGPSTISEAIPPPWLARGCSPCQWYMITCCPPQSRIMELNSCTQGWRPLLKGRCSADPLACATAIAVHRDRIAVSDPGAGQVTVLRRGGRELAFAIVMAQPGPLTWAPWHGWLVADLAASVLRQFDPSGAERRSPVPLPGTAERIAVDDSCRIWLTTRDNGVYSIWSAMQGEAFASRPVNDLLQAFGATGLRHTEEGFFCLEDSVDGERRLRCFDCHGRPAEPPPTRPEALYETHGQLLTLAIDSGMPRCRWHRVRIDADVPAGTRLSLAVSTNEDEMPMAQGAINDLQWQGFAAGLPHPDDWNEGPQGAHDFLIDQPPGRYLFLRLRLTGDGFKTPLVRRVQLDFPRQTSLDRLPAVYQENPAGADFGERFLSLFDATIADIDRAIERYPALLDVDGVPQELLPWLGEFLGVAMDPAWTPEQRRAILKAIPELYARRGTPASLAMALKLVLGADAAITESVIARPWGAVGQSRLEGVRLFGQSNARVRLGRSALSSAPLWSVGNPDLDAIASGAHRFRVLLPAPTGPEGREQASQLVEALKPAHTVAEMDSGGMMGLVIGPGSRVGINTALVPLPPPVLGGASGIRLNRASVLWASGSAHSSLITIGRASAVGIHTIME